MQLPNAESAFIDDRKLLEYCLNPEHEEGKHKARVFLAALGIRRESYLALKSAILEAILVEDAELTAELNSGNLYQVDFTMTYLEKSARIRTGWIVRSVENFPRLTTCFVMT